MLLLTMGPVQIARGGSTAAAAHFLCAVIPSLGTLDVPQKLGRSAKAEGFVSLVAACWQCGCWIMSVQHQRNVGSAVPRLRKVTVC